TAAPAWPRLGHNFANDLAVSIDERHSPLRFIAARKPCADFPLKSGDEDDPAVLLEKKEKSPPSRSTEKSWVHFRPSAVDCCCSRLAIGAATERARALAMPAGTRAKPYKRDSSGVAPASPRVA